MYIDLNMRDGIGECFRCHTGLKEILIPYYFSYSFWRIEVSICFTDESNFCMTLLRWMVYASAVTWLMPIEDGKEVGGPLMESNLKHLKHVMRKLTLSWVCSWRLSYQSRCQWHNTATMQQVDRYLKMCYPSKFQQLSQNCMQYCIHSRWVLCMLHLHKGYFLPWIIVVHPTTGTVSRRELKLTQSLNYSNFSFNLGMNN